MCYPGQGPGAQLSVCVCYIQRARWERNWLPLLCEGMKKYCNSQHTHTDTYAHAQSPPSSSRDQRHRHNKLIALYSLFSTICSFCCCPDKNSSVENQDEKSSFLLRILRKSLHSSLLLPFFSSFNRFKEVIFSYRAGKVGCFFFFLVADVFFISCWALYDCSEINNWLHWSPEDH